MTPTESAQSEFKRGINHVLQASGDPSNVGQIWPVMVNLLQGLEAIAIAQRATYIKLEEIEAQLKRQAARSANPF
jgi:hypothetical protein